MPKFDPSLANGWESVVHGLSSPKTPPSNLPLLKPGMMAQPPVIQASKNDATMMCAIPLTRIPADPNIDPGMRYDLRPGAQTLDNMPHAKAMPVCPENPRVR